MPTKPDFVVFYAWQSDRPGNSNRYLIQEAATQAARLLNADADTPYEIRIDQDTQGVPGLCDIPATILAKIDTADAFLCDLTYIARSETSSDNNDSSPRMCSNPNVLFELGYAFRTLGPERVICVMNEYYGPAAEQIFDLAHRRFPITYKLPQDRSSRKEESHTLASKLASALTSIFPLGRRADLGASDRVEKTRNDFESRVREGKFHELVRRHGAMAIAVIPGIDTRLSHMDIQAQHIPTPGRNGWNRAIRGHSVLSISNQGDERISLTEARTDGVILGADTWILDPTYHPEKNFLIPSTRLESSIINTTLNYLQVLTNLQAPLPWTVTVSLLEVNGYQLYVSVGQDRWKAFPERDIIPEPIVISTTSGTWDRQQVATLLRPALDFIWREFGFQGCYNFTDSGIYNQNF